MLLWVLPFYIGFNGFQTKEIIYKYVLGCSPSQLWFLPMLFWIFIIAYFLFHYHKPNEIGLLICMSISIVGGQLLSKIVFFNVFQIINVVKYIMFYYLGAYLYEKRIEMGLRGIGICTICSVGGYILSNYILNNEKVFLKIVCFGIDTAGSIAGILMCYGIALLIGDKIRECVVWDKLRQNSFGIYLFHQQWIYLCIMVFNGNVASIIQVILSFFISLLFSNIMVEILRKFRITKKLFRI